MIKYQKDTSDIVILTMDMAGRSHNIINHEIGKAFIPVLTHLKAEKAKGRLRGVVITSAKKTFLTGGDLDYLYQTEDVNAIFNFSEKLKEIYREIEIPGVPVVAAINGAALGNGFELALACHYRILINHSKAFVGLPETSLGLMPGGGGVIRLLWMLGIEKAFPILSKGKRLLPKEALEVGLVDELASDHDDMIQKAYRWIENNQGRSQPWDDPNQSIPKGDARNYAISQKIAGITASLFKRGQNNYPAPLAILNTMVEGSLVNFDTATRIESRYFTQLLRSRTSKNMTKAFWYDLNAIREGASRPRGYGKFRARRIGIIGAGRMGSSLSYVSAIAGLEVILKDVSKLIANRGKRYSEELLRKRVGAGDLTQQEMDTILKKITPTENAIDFEDCDLVLETVFENHRVKAQVTKAAEYHLDKYSFFVSCTSTLSITALAKASIRPQNFIGLRFHMPIEKVSLVEIIKGKLTSLETLSRAFDFAKKIRRIPILVNDNPGFFTYRVCSAYISEGLLLLQEGESPGSIEQAGLRAGMPKGPLTLADEHNMKLSIPLSHSANKVLNVMRDELQRTGKQKGRGFYTYDSESELEPVLWDGLVDYFPSMQSFFQKEMIDRMLFIQVLETIRCLEENVITSVPDANIGSIYGWGFPASKGGALQFVNDYGFEKFIQRVEQLRADFGERFEVPKLVKKMLEKKEEF